MSNNFFPSLICFIADADAVDTGSERFESNSIETVDTIADDFPSDISAKGQEKIQQNFRGHKFPKQTDGRSFQPTWIDKYSWIEYSIQQDRVYCYSCRQFAVNKPNDVFITGYNGWKR